MGVAEYAALDEAEMGVDGSFPFERFSGAQLRMAPCTITIREQLAVTIELNHG